MEFIDLHVHSSASDGTLAPGLVTELALERDCTPTLSPITIQRTASTKP